MASKGKIIDKATGFKALSTELFIIYCVFFSGFC